MIISFAWTTRSFLAGEKTCTRRRWDDRYFQKWVDAYVEGRTIHDAYDKTPRFGGKKVGRLELTCKPYKERLTDMPDDDVIAEGGLWADKREFIDLFGDPEEVVCVIRFKPILEKVE